MQPVNVLPTFVSQDADLKNKDSSTSSEAQDKDGNFSRLIEQHVSDESKITTNKESLEKVASSTAKSGSTIATNAKIDSSEVNPRQESDSSAKDDAGNEVKVSQENTEDSPSSHVLAKENDVDNESPKKGEALTESEQFISLLYNSDQTLTKPVGQSKSAEQVIGVTSAASQKTSSEITQNVEILDKINKVGTASNDVGKSALSDSTELSFAHKLKAFSKDELLTRAKLKDNTFSKQQSEQVLKDYQQSLQSSQNLINSQSITSAQSAGTKLDSIQLNNNKVTDLAVSISQASKGQLTEKIDSGLYQLPVEPIGKGELSGDASPVLVKDTLTTKNNLLATEASTKVDSAKSKLANDISDAITNKTSNNEQSSNITKMQPAIPSTDKTLTERNSSVANLVENTLKEPSVQGQDKQSVMTSTQSQALQHIQAQQKIPAVVNEAQTRESADEGGIDAMLVAEETPLEQSVKIPSKLNDSIATRSASELQAISTQTAQIKQNNDAYNEHQVSEVLNHNVATDTAQIQKNNVQLQQETIAIFRKDFADAVKDKVMIMINQKLQQFDITLDPPEFGNMQVRVNLQGEQAAVSFVVQNQQAKDALEQNMHKLRDMLAEQGVDVGGANVEQQSQQQNNDESNMEQSSDRATLLASQNDDEDNVEHVLSAQLFDSSATGVDYYA